MLPNSVFIVDRADKVAAENAAQRQTLTSSADAFRGVHLDPKAQHWDEVRNSSRQMLLISNVWSR